MESPSLPIACPVSRTPGRRLIDVLRGVWHRWKQRREDDSVLETLSLLDAHTLKDIGIPAEFRAQAAALRDARSDKLAELTR